MTIRTIHHCVKLNVERNSPLEALVRMSRGGWQCVSGGWKGGGAGGGLPDSCVRGDGMRYHMIMICPRHAHTSNTSNSNWGGNVKRRQGGRSLIPAVLANEIGVARPMDSNWKSRSWRIIRPDCGASSRETGVLWRQVKVKATETTKAQTIKQQTARKKMYIQSKN